MKVTVVAGNPKPGSRTLDAAGLVATAVTGASADSTVDVIELG
ncbi:NADPH-dependent oxidoreductase, partial [Rhodococcus sp. WS4]